MAEGKAVDGEGEPEIKRTMLVDEHKGHYVKALSQVMNQAE